METFTVAELAKYLNTSSRTIRRLIKDGTLPYFKVRNVIKFKKTSIDAWINNQEFKNSNFELEGGNTNES